MNDKVFNVGIVGAGAISKSYINSIQKKFPILHITKICANHIESAQKRAEEYGLIACTKEELFADPEIDIVINLTPACVHYEIVKAALLAGKHVYTEKTITDDPKSAFELMALANEKGLYLGSAPDTFLGAGIQTARKAIEDGLLGEITSFNVAANRNNDILLSLFSFLRMPGGGICYDYAVYYLTALIALLGPVAKTAAIVRKPYPTHVNIIPTSPEFGQVMDTPNESEVYAIMQMENGVSGTFHMNADSIFPDLGVFTIYGTKGILKLGDPNQFGSSVTLLQPTGGFGETQETLLPMVNEYTDESRGLGVADMARAILDGRKPCADKELACHVLDILAAMLASGEDNTFKEIASTCERPAKLSEN